MSAAEVVIRGNTVSWLVQFTGVDGNPVIPTAVSVFVDYRISEIDDTARDTIEITMDEDSEGNFTADWTTTAAAAGRAFWSVRAVNPDAAEDGVIVLKANPANPDSGLSEPSDEPEEPSDEPSDIITEWPDETNRPTFSGSTLTWVGPLDGGPSTVDDVQQSHVLTDTAGRTITTDGEIVEYENIGSQLTINADNVTVRRCRLAPAGGFRGMVINSPSAGLVVEDCEIDGTGTINGYGFLNVGPSVQTITIRRCNIHHFEDGGYIAKGYWRDNYIHDNATAGGDSPHYDGIVCDGGEAGMFLSIEHNHIVNIEGQNSCVYLSNFFGALDSITVNNNLLVGGSFTMFVDGQFSGGAITNVSITNNFMGTGVNGYMTFNSVLPTHTGNVDYLTLVSVD